MKSIVNFTILAVALFLSLFLEQCKNADEKKRIVFGDFIVEGKIKIDNDTTFEGLIKFYDRKTEKLSYEENYRNGIAEGASKSYFPNGIIKTELSFSDGKELGFVNYFDTSGNIISRNYMYYGIRMGPGLDYKNGKLMNYYFYDFDNDLLFSLNYDSLKGHRINESQKGFFYYVSYDILHENEHQKSYLLYIINPPKYKFDYSVVIVDENYNIKKVIEQFPSDLVFVKFRTQEHNKNFKYALQLKVHDSMNDLTNIMFKVLN